MNKYTESDLLRWQYETNVFPPDIEFRAVVSSKVDKVEELDKLKIYIHYWLKSKGLDVLCGREFYPIVTFDEFVHPIHPNNTCIKDYLWRHREELILSGTIIERGVV